MNTTIAQQIANEGGVEAYLHAQQHKSLLRFLTCGSVDDGKSTLIGRLLHDTRQIYEDQLSSLHNDSKRHGTQGEKLDLALLVDGLQAEREQGITIDVAYRYFSTEKRKFIIADTPGHEQYTRNMATGASTCDLAILLMDARKGVLDQTRRHSFISTLLGIKHLVVAVNKMDLVNFSEEKFEEIRQSYLTFAEQLPGNLDIRFVPLSALEGDNVASQSANMPWYSGPTLLEVLETVEIQRVVDTQPMRFPVQYVNRPNLDFRGFSGTIASGSVKVGQRVKVLPSGVESAIARIVTFDGDLQEAGAGEAVTLVLKDEIDISRGDCWSTRRRRWRGAGRVRGRGVDGRTAADRRTELRHQNCWQENPRPRGRHSVPGGHQQPDPPRRERAAAERYWPGGSDLRRAAGAGSVSAEPGNRGADRLSTV